MLTATFEDPACGPIALNVTIEVTQALTVGDTNTSVDPNSTNNPVTLDIDGYEITAVAVASQPANGTATASGTAITYTPADGFSGADSFTYTTTNAAGTSASATATITVSAPPIVEDVLVPPTEPIASVKLFSSTSPSARTLSIRRGAGRGFR